VLTIGDTISTAGNQISFDPTKGTSGETTGYLRYVYDSLLVRNINGTYSPELALSATITNPTTIEVKLRPGVKFQDGTPLNAAAVQFTILRNKKAANAATMRASLLAEMSSVDVTSSLDLTIHLSQPVAGAFYDLLADIETAPVSPTAVKDGKNLATDPVGAGPFELASQSSTLVKLKAWPGYWDAKDVHLAGINIVDIESSSALVNALQTGSIDYDPRTAYANLAQLGSSVNTVTSLPTGAVPSFDLVNFNCSGFKPLANADLREALLYATNPSQINSLVYQGKAKLMTQLTAPGSDIYNSGITVSYNLAKAKQLLAAAGVTSLTIPAMDESAQGQQEVQEQEILQQQWAAAGINLKITPVADSVDAFYVTGKLGELAYVGAQLSDMNWFTTYFTPGAGGATCAPSDPTYVSEVKTLEGLDPTSAEAISLTKKINAYLVQNAYYIPLLQAPVALASSKQLGKITYWQSRAGDVFPDFRGTYFS
jgi:peptide/nickel transport system substrate-binding protein